MSRALLCVIVAVGFACLYLFTSPMRIENIDGQERFEVSWAVLHKGRPAPDRGDYLRLVVVPGRRAKEVSYYGMGHSLLGLPFVLAARVVAGDSRVAGEIAFSLINPLVAAGAIGVFLLLLLRLHYHPGPALGAALLLGTASSLWPAALTCMEGPQVALCLVLLLLAAEWRRREPGYGPLLLAAVAMGWLLLTRETDTAAALPLLLLVLLVRGGDVRQIVRDTALLLLFCLPFLLAYVGYNLWRYDSLSSLSGRVQILHKLGVPVYGNPLRALYGLTLSTGKGLLFFSPLVLPGLLGLWRMRRREPGLCRAVAATSLLTLLTIVPLAAWRGDWTWGPRYLFGLLPLLHLGVAEVLAMPGMRPKVGLLSIAGVAVLVQLAGVTVFPYRYFLHHALGTDYVYGQRLPDPGLPSQLFYHLREMPVVISHTGDRLTAAGRPQEITRSLDLACAPMTPVPLRGTGPIWAQRVATFDAVPFFWIYYDLATSGAMRLPLRLLAGCFLLLALVLLGCIAPLMTEHKSIQPPLTALGRAPLHRGDRSRGS